MIPSTTSFYPPSPLTDTMRGRPRRGGLSSKLSAVSTVFGRRQVHRQIGQPGGEIGVQLLGQLRCLARALRIEDNDDALEGSHGLHIGELDRPATEVREPSAGLGSGRTQGALVCRAPGPMVHPTATSGIAWRGRSHSTLVNLLSGRAVDQVTSLQPGPTGSGYGTQVQAPSCLRMPDLASRADNPAEGLQADVEPGPSRRCGSPRCPIVSERHRREQHGEGEPAWCLCESRPSAGLAKPDDWATCRSLRIDRGMDQRGRATRAIAVHWCHLRQLRGRSASRVGCAGVLGSLGPTPLPMDSRDAARPAWMAPR
jgi:hypothetical protein